MRELILEWFTITITIQCRKGKPEMRRYIVPRGSVKKSGWTLGARPSFIYKQRSRKKFFEAKTMESWKKHAAFSILFFTPFSHSLRSSSLSFCLSVLPIIRHEWNFVIPSLWNLTSHAGIRPCFMDLVHGFIFFFSCRRIFFSPAVNNCTEKKIEKIFL